MVDKFVNGKGEEESVARLMFTGTISGIPVKITSTAVETSGAVIKQNGTVANITGKLVFKGLTLDQPPGCVRPRQSRPTRSRALSRNRRSYLCETGPDRDTSTPFERTT